MSSSRSKINSKLFNLRQLHLTPHFVYFVQKSQFEPDKSYAFEIWKDDAKIGVETGMLKKDANSTQKHASLEFQKVRFVFDIEALFQQTSEASIVFKLTERTGQQQKIIEEFHLHILYYNYEFSKDKFIRHKQNSVGKINHYIFNYSFSALYGQKLDSLLFRKHQRKKDSVLLEDLFLTKKDSKYGVIVRDEKNIKLDTIFLIQSVASKGIAEMKNSKSNFEGNPEEEGKKIMNIEIVDDAEQDGMENVRKAARSILDDVANEKDESTLTQQDVIKQIKTKFKDISYFLLILVSSYLIFYLMHPIKKI